MRSPAERGTQASAGSGRAALRQARLAVIGLFLLVGLGLALWVVGIPAAQQRVGVSHGVLGLLLLVFGLGAFLSMQASGPLVQRFGTRRVAAAGAALLSVGLVLAGSAAQPWQLAGALFVLGVGNGGVNVAMNAEAVLVERRWGRPIMSGFHAFFSVGGAAGAGAGAALTALGLSPVAVLVVGAVLVAAVAAASLVLLPEPPAPSPRAAPAGVASSRAVHPPHQCGRLALVAVLACVLLLAEGTAADWSALQAVEDLGQSPAAAALAYAAFAVCMTVARFGADGVVHRFGSERVVRWGSALAAVGLLVVVCSDVYALTVAGWALSGLGLAGVAPQLFTAAGAIGGAEPAVAVSRVVSAGYLGLLAGPALIGWIAGGVGLSAALLAPVLFCLLGAALAGRVVRPPSAGALSSGSGAPTRTGCDRDHRRVAPGGPFRPGECSAGPSGRDG